MPETATDAPPQSDEQGGEDAAYLDTTLIVARTRIASRLRALFTPDSYADFLEEIAEHLEWESFEIRMSAAMTSMLPGTPPPGGRPMGFSDIFDQINTSTEVSTSIELSTEFVAFDRTTLDEFLALARNGREVRSLRTEMRTDKAPWRAELAFGIPRHGLSLELHWQLEPATTWALKSALRRNLRWAILQRTLLALFWMAVIIGLAFAAFEVADLRHGVATWWTAVKDYWALMDANRGTDRIMSLMWTIAFPPFALLTALGLWRGLPSRIAHFGVSRIVMEPNRVRLALPRIRTWLVSRLKIFASRDAKIGLVAVVTLAAGWAVAAMFSDTAPGNVFGIVGVAVALLAWLRPRTPGK